jgi:hypothetical protein
MEQCLSRGLKDGHQPDLSGAAPCRAVVRGCFLFALTSGRGKNSAPCVDYE